MDQPFYSYAPNVLIKKAKGPRESWQQWALHGDLDLETFSQCEIAGRWREHSAQHPLPSPDLLQLASYVQCLYRHRYGEIISQPTLQALCFYIYAHSLGHQHYVFNDVWEAWPEGPRIPSLFHVQLDDALINFERYKDHQFIDNVIYAYGGLAGPLLQSIVRREQVWLDARSGLGRYKREYRPMDSNEIREAFLTRTPGVGHSED